MPKPTVGGDTDTWGGILNSFLDVALNTDGTLRVPSGAVAGDVMGTANGTSITRIRPGRIDLRVRGGVGNDSTSNTTLLATLATEAATAGAELWIPDGIYRGFIEPVSHLRINGTGTLKATTGLAATKGGVIDYYGNNLQDMHIRGITIDGNGEVAPITVYASSTSTNVLDCSVIQCILVNSGASDPKDKGLRFGLVSNFLVMQNFISDVGEGVAAGSADRLRCLYNTVRATTGNAFTGAMGDAGVETYGNQWIGNVGIDIGRMGIELIAPGNGVMHAPIISQNHMSMISDLDAYGYSIVGPVKAVISNNVAVAPDEIATYGFELGTQTGENGMIVSGNVALGFETGYILNDLDEATLTDNISQGSLTAFRVGTNTRWCVLRGNQARSFRDNGIVLGGFGTGVLNGGHLIDGNLILRDAAWSGDDSRTWRGIQMEEQVLPSQVVRNRIVQAQASPTAGMNAHGIAATIDALGELAGSEIERNQFIDLATVAMLDPLNGNGSFVSDIDLVSNKLTLATGVTSAVSSW